MHYVKQSASLVLSFFICTYLALAATPESLKHLQLPIYFEQNTGQYPPEVQFLARARKHTLFLTRDEAVLSAPGKDVIRMRLVGASHDSKLEGVDDSSHRSNYLIGADPSKWRTGVPSYAQVKESGVYPGIDLIYHQANRQIEYDFVAQPGANTGLIRLRYSGASSLKLDRNGDLLLTTASGVLRHQKPVIFQEIAGRKTFVSGAFQVFNNAEVGFLVGRHDPTQPLTIDPSLSYATYLGGANDETLGDIAADTSGNLYVTGSTLSAGFPTTSGAYKNNCGTASNCNGTTDAFVAKVSADGTSLVYSTFIGGSGAEQAFRIRVDGSGNAYVYGSTGSLDFPLTSGTLTVPTGSRTFPFLLKLNASGTGLVYSSRLPSPIQNSNTAGATQGSLFAVDASGAAYFADISGAGLTTTGGAYQSAAAGGMDAFALKINPTASAIQYATYLGGTADETVTSIAVDSTGALYVAGSTYSSNFPATNGALQTGPPSADMHGFVAKFNAAGSGLMFSTYLGGTGPDMASHLALDSSNNILVSGTASGNFPGPSPAVVVDSSKYLVRLAANGGSILNSARIGTDTLWLDQSNNLYTQSSGAIYELSPDLSSVLVNYPVCLGGACAGFDRFTATMAGKMFGASRTTGGVQATTNAYQSSPAGGYDIVLESISPSGGGSSPVFSAAFSHGVGFTQGQTGAVYTMTVSNTGPVASAGAVVVSAVLPASLTLVAISGSGWSCNYAATCTRSDALAPASSFPPLTVTANVASNAPAQITNTVNISGGGAPNVSVTDNVPVGGVTPQSSGASGSGLSNTFTFSFSSPGGSANVRLVDVLINNFLDGRHACYIAFLPSGANGGSIYLVDDAGEAGGPYAITTVPGSGTVRNSQCTVGGSGASVSFSGGTYTLTLPIAFDVSFAGNKSVYVAAQDQAGISSGWQALSTWGVPGQFVTGPSVGSMSPANGSFLNQTYSFTFNNSLGWTDINVVNVLVNDFLDGRRACYLAILPGTSSVYLVDDAGEAGGPYSIMTLPGSGSVQNSQCSIAGTGSSISGSGNALNVTLAMTFNQSFAGNRIFYLATQTSHGLSSGWQTMGAVNIP